MALLLISGGKYAIIITRKIKIINKKIAEMEKKEIKEDFNFVSKEMFNLTISNIDF